MMSSILYMVVQRLALKSVLASVLLETRVSSWFMASFTVINIVRYGSLKIWPSGSLFLSQERFLMESWDDRVMVVESVEGLLFCFYELIL